MKRALLIGSRTGGLSGVHADIELMDDVLGQLGFTTMPTTEGEATADGIVRRYCELIESTGSDDAALVYYSGNGGRVRNPLAATDPTLPPWVDYIVPTDGDDRSGGRSRCLLADELSVLQRELSAKTPNVTAIQDCCHAARMSCDADAVPKASDPLVDPDDELVRRWRRLRPAARAGDAGPDPVRLVACAPDECAYESWNAARGSRHGVLTAALASVLTRLDVAASTWNDALAVLVQQVLGAATGQRPTLLGPADRVLFALEGRSGTGVQPLRIEQGLAVLSNAALVGIAVGDSYTLVAPDTNSTAPVVTAVVERIDDDRAVLRIDGGLPAAQLPVGTAAYPAQVALSRRPVAVRAPAGPGRDAVVAVLRTSVRVRPVDDPEGALATVVLDGDTVQVLDAGERPLYPRPRPASRIGMALAAVAQLAVAEQVRGLAAGDDGDALPDVSVSHLRLLDDGSRIPVGNGEHMFVGDRLVVRFETASGQPRFASAFDVGMAGAVTQLTTFAPEGVALVAGVPYDVGREGNADGIPLRWPVLLPVGAPRLETVVTVVADTPVAGLCSLGQPADSRSAPRSANRLDRLIDDLAVGRRDATPLGDSDSVDKGGVDKGGVDSGSRHRVDRLDVVVHPAPRPVDGEPPFEIDERPDPSFRLVVPEGSPAAPTRMAVRLRELTVHSTRTFLASRVRVDAVVITAAPPEAGLPYRAGTMRFAGAGDGSRLPLDDVLLYQGPVDRFLDIAMWISKDDARDPDLDDLLATEISRKDLAGASATLAALAVDRPDAGLVASSAAAVATVVHTAAHVIEEDSGTSLGVYRTSLLPHRGFGVDGAPGGGLGRHPEHGLVRAEEMSFALEFIDLAFVDGGGGG